MPRSVLGNNHAEELPLITVGANAAGIKEAQTAIKRNTDGLIEMNVRESRARMEARAAAHQQAAPLLAALESQIKEKDPSLFHKIPREKILLDLQSETGPVKMRKEGQQALLSLQLEKHVSVHVAPFDFGWSWGNPTIQVSDHQNGMCSVWAQSAYTGAAAAGVSLLLTSDKPAIVFVRPWFTASWGWAAKALGIGSSAKVRGGFDASAWVDGEICTPLRRDQVFEGSLSWFDGYEEDKGRAAVWQENIELNFRMLPRKTYAVSYGVWAECEHNTAVGAAGSTAGLDGQLLFVVIERYAAG